jgi:hypothetical protein
MCISSDENMRSNRRPVSRNNEHDYSAWKIDEYDMDLSEYLIEGSTLKDEESSRDHFVQQSQNVEPTQTFEATFDETQNFDISTKKKARKSYACPICSKLWVTPSKLKRHLGSHKTSVKEKSLEPPEQQIQCPICNSLLDSPHKLTQHMADMHIKHENQPEYENGIPLAQIIGTRYICTVCSFEFSTPSKLQNHMKVQHMKPENLATTKARHICKFCHKILVTPSKLQRHLRTHNKTKEEHCETKRSFRPRRHECIHCGKKFETPSKLLRHMTSVHRDSCRDLNKNANSSETALEISTVTSILGD